MAWRRLHLSPSAGAHLAPLLISEAFTPNSYAVQLTDLTHVWSESLDRGGILRRSREQSTSIDPSEGDQLQIFLDKLKLGLAGAKDTTLALTITAAADRPSLVLDVTVKLPGGLVPLQWPIQLAAAPQAVMTSQLVVPLLRAQHVRMQEIAGLEEMLRNKDHVIQKLLDKLEAQGTELGQIFPQAAGKAGGRKLDRKKAENRVKGLGQFDMNAWRKGRDHERSRDIAGLLEDVFEEDVFEEDNADICGAEPSDLVPEEPGSWWESIKGITIDLSTGRFSTNGPSGTRKSPAKPQPALRKEDTIEEDDAFQVQATPPRLASPSKRASSIPVINDSTEDDDDLDAPTQRSKMTRQLPILSTCGRSVTKKDQEIQLHRSQEVSSQA